MGVTAALRRFAFQRPKAFPIVGRQGTGPLRKALRSQTVAIGRAPHDSDLLLLCGDIPDTWCGPLRSLFETLPLPRLAAWLRPDRLGATPPNLPLVELDPDRPDRAALLRRLLDRQAPNNRPILPDEPPAPWRGEGDHGQGGEGMMGGTPYGRPMAMVGPDPDGLTLGAVSTSLGPFFPGLPCGLQVELTLQGDRVSSIDAVTNWFPERPAAELPGAEPAVGAALGGGLPAADLERERIASHLSAMAAILDLAGLPAVAHRLATVEDHDPRRLARLFRSAERRGLRPVLSGVGRLTRDQAKELAVVGPVARASGLSDDARSGDPAYASAGFAAVVGGEGDAWARWSVLRDECLQSATMLPRLAGHVTRAAEGPRGPHVVEDGALRTASRANVAAIEPVLSGALWSEALLGLASLGLNMQEAALR